MLGKGLIGCEHRKMDALESTVLLALITASLDDTLLKRIETELVKTSPGYQILESRLHGAKVSTFLLIFISGLYVSPGGAVMWAYTLNEMYCDVDREVTFGDFVKNFPMGVPTTDAYNKMWDAQKGYNNDLPNVDNMIDDYANWRSV